MEGLLAELTLSLPVICLLIQRRLIALVKAENLFLLPTSGSSQGCSSQTEAPEQVLHLSRSYT